MLQKDYLAEVLEDIEYNINQPFHIQDISAVKYVSIMQLYRDFYNLTGHSIKEYIRKRKLSNALAMLKHSEKSLIEIAYSYGYSSQQAFCKYVKAATGLTPTEYRSSDGYYYYPRFCIDSRHQICVSSENIPKAIHMKYYHSQIRGIENRSLAYLFSVLPNYTGRIFGRNGKQLNNKFCYELDIEYREDIINVLKSSEFQEIRIELPKTDVYAKITVKNTEREINLAWDYLYLEWLKISMFEQTDNPYFEEYVHKGDNVKRLILYLPVKKRSDYNRITIKDCEDMYFLASRCGGADAERKASKYVLDYLLCNNPSYINTMYQFYVANHESIYVCGVMINETFRFQKDKRVERLHIEGGRYAVLEGDCCGDNIVFERMLSSWIVDNGFSRGGSPGFTIYEANGSFEQKDIKTFVYMKLG